MVASCSVLVAGSSSGQWVVARDKWYIYIIYHS